MITLLRQRRSIRAYQKKPVELAKIEILKEALLRSPSSRNFKPCEFIFVDSGEIINKLKVSKQHGSAFLCGAPLAVVILGDSNKSDVWIEDCSIASILLQLTAQSLGLGSCWVQIRLRQHDEKISSMEYVQKLLNIPPHIKVESIVGIGYPAEEKTGISREQLDDSKIFFNSYNPIPVVK